MQSSAAHPVSYARVIYAKYDLAGAKHACRIIILIRCMHTRRHIIRYIVIIGMRYCRNRIECMRNIVGGNGRSQIRVNVQRFSVITITAAEARIYI